MSSDIALRAFQLWDAAGRPEGRSEEFYFLAEEEFRQLVGQHGPSVAKRAASLSRLR